MCNKLINSIHRDQRGITGLETAIILIAFIVVASVFAYTVLSAGLFSSQKAEETIHSGIGTAESTMSIKGGNVIGYTGTTNGDECVTKLSFIVANALDSAKAIDLTPPYHLNSSGALVAGPPATYGSAVISDCETNWTASANVTAALDSADTKEGSNSVKLTVADGFTTGLAAYYAYTAPAPENAVTAARVQLWIKSSLSQTAGNIQLLLCSDAAGTTPVATGTLDIPALTANVWQEVSVDLSVATVLSTDTVKSIGIKAVADPGATVINVDDVNAAILTTGGNNNNVTMIAYDDGVQVIDDVAWTVEIVAGIEEDDDYLLENTEKATITVWLQNYDGSAYSNGSGISDPFIDSNTNHLKSNDAFHLQVMPPRGATLLIEKRTPAYLDPVMRLY
ncbi:MAG: hypothetical protein PHV74_03230 [Dehalococcoidia bacterium]|nr:hypothetical protein [Dehalococcoidia bacterium]